MNYPLHAGSTRIPETTRGMISKRGAAQFVGPSAEKEVLQKRELEERYGPLKPFGTEDASIEKLPPTINTEEIINAWKNSPAIRAYPKKKKPTKTEGERVRDLMRNKTGMKRRWAFTAMRASYRTPSSMQME